MRHRLAGPLAVAAAVMALDRMSKVWITRHVSAWDVWPVIQGYVNIIHAENPGMAFSLLATASDTVRTFVLIGLASVVLVLVTMMLWRSSGGLPRSRSPRPSSSGSGGRTRASGSPGTSAIERGRAP